MSMLSQQSSALRELTHPEETNDCTVVALANAAGISYQDAHTFARQAGRKPRHGMKPDAVKSMLRSLDISGVATTRQMIVPQPTRFVLQGYARRYSSRRQGVSVTSFIRTLPKRGRFYLACTSHAFAYIDGVVIDNLQRPRSRATMYLAYEIIPSVKAEAEPKLVITQSQINELWDRLNKLEAKWKA